MLSNFFFLKMLNQILQHTLCYVLICPKAEGTVASLQYLSCICSHLTWSSHSEVAVWFSQLDLGYIHLYG